LYEYVYNKIYGSYKIISKSPYILPIRISIMGVIKMAEFTSVRILPRSAEAKKALPRVRSFALEIGLKAEMKKDRDKIYLIVMGDNNGIHAFLRDFPVSLDLDEHDFIIGSITSMNIDGNLLSIITSMAVFAVLPVYPSINL